jgi:hypothetical protein
MAQQMVMIRPKDADKKIAQGVTEKDGPEFAQSSQVRFMRNLQLQDHNRDDDGNDAVRECCEPLRRGSLFGHLESPNRF